MLLIVGAQGFVPEAGFSSSACHFRTTAVSVVGPGDGVREYA